MSCELLQAARWMSLCNRKVTRHQIFIENECIHTRPTLIHKNHRPPTNARSYLQKRVILWGPLTFLSISYRRLFTCDVKLP